MKAASPTTAEVHVTNEERKTRQTTKERKREERALLEDARD
jgi:hypothetical protein